MCGSVVARMGNMPELPFSRRHALAGAAVLVVVLFVGGRLFLRTGAAVPAQPLPPPPLTTAPVAPAQVVIDIAGAVRRPGLYRLRQGARVADAVRRAGGATRRADLSLVNLAQLVADGEQVIVPRRGAPAPPSGGGGGGAATMSGPVHLNSATVEQLDVLPGVGPVTAQKIVDYRTKHGAFSSVDELDAISGIGPARLDQLRDLVAP
jgi:competence protein ComEA